MSTENNATAAEPMHITASLASLLILAHEHQLPESVGVEAIKANGTLTVFVDSVAARNAWADALDIPMSDRNSTVHPDRSELHTAWCEWNGWHLRLWCSLEAPPSVVAVAAAMLSALEVISRPRTAVMLP